MKTCVEQQEVDSYEKSLRWARALNNKPDGHIEDFMEHLNFQVERDEITKQQRRYIMLVMLYGGTK